MQNLNGFLQNYNAGKKPLASLKCFVFDLDGTIYLSSRFTPGATEFLRFLRGRGVRTMFFTNNSSRNSAFYVEKLRRMGYMEAAAEDMATSTDVLTEFIRTKRAGKSVFPVGTEFFVRDFEQAGIPISDHAPDIVAVGLDSGFDYRKAAEACNFLRGGAEFFAANDDLVCPVENGFVPDCGSICAMLSAASGKKPRFFGKPEAASVDFLIAKTGLAANEIAFVGDRLYTDIALGRRGGMAPVLFLTGEARPEDVLSSDIRPDYIFADPAGAQKFMEEHRLV